MESHRELVVRAVMLEGTMETVGLNTYRAPLTPITMAIINHAMRFIKSRDFIVKRCRAVS
jgi:hypothetical protein